MPHQHLHRATQKWNSWINLYVERQPMDIGCVQPYDLSPALPRHFAVQYHTESAEKRCAPGIFTHKIKHSWVIKRALNSYRHGKLEELRITPLYIALLSCLFISCLLYGLVSFLIVGFKVMSSGSIGQESPIHGIISHHSCTRIALSAGSF